MIYITSILFTLCFIYYSKFQFKDFKQNTDRKWKPYGMAMRVIFFGSSYLLQLFPSTWEDYVLSGVICMIIWEIGINVIALESSIFHIGTTGKIDKSLGKYKWYVLIVLLIIALFIKFIL